jgi:PAS domain S-box-containing protein
LKTCFWEDLLLGKPVFGTADDYSNLRRQCVTAIDSVPDVESGPSARRGMILIIVFLAAVMAAGITAIYHFSAHERAREVQLWQTRLGIIADTRAAAVSEWLRQQGQELSGLADNASLQIYLTEIIAPVAAGSSSPDRNADDQARGGYLSNLLELVAHRSGFSAPPVGPAIDANVRHVGVAGISLVTIDGRVVAASPGSPPVEGPLAKFLAGAPRGEPAIKDVYLDQTGAPAMAFAVPLYAMQGGAAATSQIGWVLGVKQVAVELYPLLRQAGSVWPSAEVLLVRKNGNVIEYLSPTQEGDAPLARRFAADTPDLAARFALEKPGGFATRRDYRNTEVLITGRLIAPVSWAVVYKIGRDEALGPTEDRTRRLAIILGLLVVAVGAGVIAVWRHGTSVRALRIAGEQSELARRFEAQSRFLKLITDTQPNSMFIVDGDNRYRFANRVAAGHAGIAQEDVLGKTMASVLGPAEAARYAILNRDTMENGVSRRSIHRTAANGELRVVQAEHVLVPETLDGAAGVMVIEEDITAAVAERERRSRTLDNLIGTLIAILDRRDPFAAHHSARVSETARALAKEMGFDAAMTETVATAGILLNIGKIMVPEDVLTQDGALDEGQVRMVRESIGQSAEMLAAVEFDGPVVDILREVHAQLQGDNDGVNENGEIPITAQIVMVANAFVAMTSDRAWRRGIDEGTAAGILMIESNGRYARRVVSALLNLVDNKGLVFDSSSKSAAG